MDDDDVKRVFREFQRGVQSAVSDDAVRTHADLGLAYLEMGLITDAEAEFSLVLEKEPTHGPARAALEIIRRSRDPDGGGGGPFEA